MGMILVPIFLVILIALVVFVIFAIRGVITRQNKPIALIGALITLPCAAFCALVDAHANPVNSFIHDIGTPLFTAAAVIFLVIGLVRTLVRD